MLEAVPPQESAQYWLTKVSTEKPAVSVSVPEDTEELVTRLAVVDATGAPIGRPPESDW